MLKKSGFTLIEALTVVGIIGILATITMVSMKSLRVSGRDARRVNDVNEIRSALNIYYTKYNQYPALITPGKRFEVGNIIYLEKVPSNPTPRPDNGCPNQDYIYEQTNSGLSYTINFCLGSKQGSIPDGNNIAIPEGITQ